MFRSPLILGAPVAGLLAGAALWLVFAHGSAASKEISDLDARAQVLTRPTFRFAAGSEAAGSTAAATPIFALTTGPGAVADIPVGLLGISRTPARTAALLSINGKPAEWIALGETRDQVTLDDVASDQVQVDTPLGSKEVALGATAGGASQAPNASGGGSGPAGSSSGGAPLGYHSPPAPASAPGNP